VALSARRAYLSAALGVSVGAEAFRDPDAAVWRSGDATRAYLLRLGLSADDIDESHGYDVTSPETRRVCAVMDWARWAGHTRWFNPDLAKLRDMGMPVARHMCLKDSRRRFRGNRGRY
jgi:hypothetical protein